MPAIFSILLLKYLRWAPFGPQWRCLYLKRTCPRSPQQDQWGGGPWKTHPLRALRLSPGARPLACIGVWSRTCSPRLAPVWVESLKRGQRGEPKCLCFWEDTNFLANVLNCALYKSTFCPHFKVLIQWRQHALSLYLCLHHLKSCAGQ